MKIKELRGLSVEDLLQKQMTLKKELFDLNYKKKFGQVEKPSRFRQIRKQIAQILTLINERKDDGRKNK